MTSPWARSPPVAGATGERLERLEGHRPVGVGVVVDVDPADVRLALVPVELVHVVLDRLVHVDRVFVDERLGGEDVDLADHPRPIRRGVDDHDVLLGGGPQRNRRGREVLARPVPAPVAGHAGPAPPRRGTPAAARPRPGPNRSPGSNGSSKQAALRWPSRTCRLSGSRRASSGGGLEQELRVLDDVPVHGPAAGDQHRYARPAAARRGPSAAMWRRWSPGSRPGSRRPAGRRPRRARARSC